MWQEAIVGLIGIVVVLVALRYGWQLLRGKRNPCQACGDMQCPHRGKQPDSARKSCR